MLLKMVTQCVESLLLKWSGLKSFSTTYSIKHRC